MNKKLLALFMTGASIVSLLAGCAAPAPAASSAQPAETVAEETAAAAAEPEAEAVEETAAEETVQTAPEDIIEINLSMLDVGDCSEEGKAAVVDAMNAITEQTIGVRINVTWGTFGTYGNQLSMALAANEPYDLVNPFMAPINFSTLYSNGQLIDATEYLEEYAPDLMAELGQLAENYSVGGKIYGVPTISNSASNAVLVMRKDLLEENGLLEDMEKAETWTEIEEVMTKLTEATGMAALGDVTFFKAIFGEDKIADGVTFTNFGDRQRLIFSDNEGNISSLLDNEDYKAERERIRRFYDEGLIYHDLPYFADLDGTTLIKTNQTYAWIGTGEIGIEASQEGQTGHPIYAKVLKSLPIDSLMGGFVFPVTCNEPEASAKWLNELYTNPDLQNLIVWGIEGKDYVVSDEGIASFPEGIDNSNVKYHETDWMYGNNFNALPWEGTSADFREICRQEVANAEISPYFGFTADTSELSNLIAAITNCHNEYGRRIAYGAFTEEDYEAYRADLEVAGLQDYLNAYQEQLNEWIAAR